MKRTGDQSFIKELNKSIVLNLLRFQSPISRAQISQMTGLNKATVSLLVNELIQDNLILEVGHGHARVGRRPVLLLFNSNAGHTIGVDLGVNYIRIVVTDLSAHVLLAYETDIRDPHDVGQVVNQLVSLIQDTIAKVPDSPLGIIGVGVGVPGLVDFSQGIVLNAPNLQWRDVHLKALLQSYLQLPVFVDNEANAGALGEKLFGVGKQVSDLIYVSVGTGIGTGIIVNNELWRGARGVAGEFGHMTIETNGLKCSCGNTGCLEMYASEKAILHYYEKNTGKKLTFEEIMSRLKDNDPESVQAVQAAGQYLGIGIASLLNGFNPSLVLIGNRVSQARKWILRPVEQTVRSRCFITSYFPINIQVSSLGRDACAVGAAALVLDNYFSGPKTS